jgi:hypothetical protein
MHRFPPVLLLAVLAAASCVDGRAERSPPTSPPPLAPLADGTTTSAPPESAPARATSEPPGSAPPDSAPSSATSAPPASEPARATSDGPADIEPAGARCASEGIGLAVAVPDGWTCRILSPAGAGRDGLVLIGPGAGPRVVVATPSPLDPPGSLLGIGERAEPVRLGELFPDLAAVAFAGGVTVWGRHHSVDAEVVVTTSAPLTPADSALLASVLDSTAELEPNEQPAGRPTIR